MEPKMAYTRRWALNQLGVYCLGTALDDEAKIERLIPKMESNVSRKGHGMRFAIQEEILPVAEYLVFWYRKHERIEEARRLVWPHIKDAILILSGDDPSNDGLGIYSLGSVFLAVGDTENFMSAIYANRQYSAVLRC